MPESEPIQPDTAEAPEAAPSEPQPASGRRRRGSLLGGMYAGLRQVGRDVVSVTLGRLLESQAEESDESGPDDESNLPAATDNATKRVGMLHAMTEQLRGAADSYVAAKLDEIEARVDQKLDGIEQRIDRKIVELHEQLAKMRDRELRHRLRLLKITLIFTALVAVLSLLYKWIEKIWQLA
ncbi:MAG: hypothetical protein KAY37_10735 [Phycisphaerae bacterium]|nr:hypothetical protein [Phycisphaerae bacterium]